MPPDHSSHWSPRYCSIPVKDNSSPVRVKPSWWPSQYIVALHSVLKVKTGVKEDCREDLNMAIHLSWIQKGSFTHSCMWFPETDRPRHFVSIVDKVSKMVSLGIRVPVVQLETKVFNATITRKRSRPVQLICLSKLIW